MTWRLDGNVASDEGLEPPMLIALASDSFLGLVEERQEDSRPAFLEWTSDLDRLRGAVGSHPRTPPVVA